MNREETIEAIKVMQAFVDGEDIQCSFRASQDAWEQMEPEWQWAIYRYRSVPKPREWYLARKDIPESGHYGHRVYLTTCDHSENIDFIKIVEVL